MSATDQPTCSAAVCVICHQRAHRIGEQCDAGQDCHTRRVHLGMTCRTCYDTIAERLRELPELYALAAGELAAGSGSGIGGNETTLGIRVAALELRAGHDLLGVLGSWEREWREFFDDPAPSVPAKASSDRVGADVVSVCGYLSANLHRSCRAHPAIDDFAHEVEILRQQARQAARTAGRRHVVVECPTDTVDGRCGAKLRITGMDLTDPVYCRSCRTSRDVHRLLLIAAADSESTVWGTVEDASLLFGVTSRTLHRWAASGQVVRERSRYDLGSIRDAIRNGSARRVDIR